MWPFWGPYFGTPHSGILKQKVSPHCNFFAVADCHITLNLKYRRKRAGNRSCDNSFPLYGNKKESPTAKKLQRYPNFCFCNRQITETKQIRENYPTKTEWRLNAELKGAAIHLGPAHLGRLPASTHIAPTGQNGLKKQKATEENPRWPVLLMVPATGIEPATH